MGLNERNAHPRDRQVSFDEKSHTYTINGSSEGVTSVTTLLDECFQAFDPDSVIEKYYRRWQQNPYKKPECFGKTKEQIKEMWKEEGEKAAEEGTRLHEAIEAFYNRREVKYDKKRKEWSQFLSFQQQHKLSAHRTEMTLWSSDHKLGGRLDLIVKNEDGSYSIYDWKRTKNEIRKDEHHWGRFGNGPLSNVKDNKYYRFSVQLNLYRELLECYYGYKVKSMYVVRFHPSAKRFEVSEIDRMEKEAGDLLESRRKDVVTKSTKEDIHALANKFSQSATLNEKPHVG